MGTGQEYFEPAIGALLRMAWERLQDEIYAELAAAGFDDVRPAHRPVIQRFPPCDGLRPSQIAANINLSKQAVNDLLRDLERMGYLTLEPDPADGRARIIRYTDRGWRLFNLGGTISRAVSERWAEAIGRERIDTLAEILRAIRSLPRNPASDGR
jgi:DNA-binding MarR family transcriptional regulator